MGFLYTCRRHTSVFVGWILELHSALYVFAFFFFKFPVFSTGRKLSQWLSSKAYFRRSCLVEIYDRAVVAFGVLAIHYTTPFWKNIPNGGWSLYHCVNDLAQKRFSWSISLCWLQQTVLLCHQKTSHPLIGRWESCCQRHGPVKVRSLQQYVGSATLPVVTMILARAMKGGSYWC